MQKHLGRIAFVVLLIAFLVVVGWLTVRVVHLYRQGELRPTGGFHRTHPRRTLTNPAQIQSWMTFSYINTVFNLPAGYLVSTLKMQDARYPDLTIRQYARTHDLNEHDVTDTVEGSVSQYLQRATK